MRLKLLAKSLTGEEVARDRELIDTLSIGYGVKTDHLLAVMRAGGASVNNAAVGIVKVVRFLCIFVPNLW